MCGILRKRLEKERYFAEWSDICLKIKTDLALRPRTSRTGPANNAAENVKAAVRFAVSESIAAQSEPEQWQKMPAVSHSPDGGVHGQVGISGDTVALTHSATTGGFAKDDVTPIGIGKALQMRKSAAANTYGAKPLEVLLPESIASSWEQFQARSQSFQRAMTLCD